MSTQTPDRAARIAHKNAQIERSRQSHWEAVDWARSVGFSERQAPFAASVASTMKSQKKRPVTYTEVKDRMLAQWPDLEKV